MSVALIHLFGPCILNLPCSVYLSRRHVNNSREDYCQRREGDCRLDDDFNYYNYWKIIQQHHRFVFCLGRKVWEGCRRKVVRGFSVLARMLPRAAVIYRLDRASSDCSRFEIQPGLVSIKLS